MILSHFTDKFLDFNPNMTYSQNKYHSKPAGFWLSNEVDGGGWKSWCESEDFLLDHLAIETRFQIDVPNCLILSNYKAIKDFTEKYFLLEYEVLRSIDWIQVKKDYSGLIITPYYYEARFEFMWYSGWDCASACIWDLSVLDQI